MDQEQLEIWFLVLGYQQLEFSLWNLNLEIWTLVKD
jgi:hypothetical protein